MGLREELDAALSRENYLRILLQDFANHGLRFDLNPTHMLSGGWEESERFWHAYFKDANDSLKRRARKALEKADAVSDS